MERQDNMERQFLDACKTGDVEIVVTLLPLLDPSFGNNLALRWASYEGQIDIVRLLLDDSRVDPLDSPSENNYNTAMEWARTEGYTNIDQLFTEYQFRLDGPEYNKNIL